MSVTGANLRFSGRAISPGLVIGRAFVYREKNETPTGPTDIEEHQIKEELERIDQAVTAVAEDLRISAQRIEADTNARLAAIFHAHEAMLHDPGLRGEIRELVQQDLMSGAYALARVFRRWERKFREMGDEKQRQTATDMADLRQRLLRQIAGIKTTPLEKMPPGRVLVAHQLAPSDTVALPRQALTGIVVEFGGPGSHAALLAEALGIPTVVQAADVLTQIVNDDELIVDGFRGEVILRPDAGTQAQYAEAIQHHKTTVARITQSARGPCRTRRGTDVKVLANVGCREDVMAAAESGADGIGLFRMEQYYLARKTPPDAAELRDYLRWVFEPMAEKPITIRLLDLGGDKPVPFLNLPPEDNPFLGQRGVRLLFKFPDLLDTQLQALWQFSQEQDLRILVPMVTLAEEMAQIRDRFTSAASLATRAGLPPLGAMVETPAAALSVQAITKHADFLSIGTNDLTQYTMAASRENPLVNDYFQEDHPAIFRLVRMIVEEAGEVPVTICGELARQLEQIPNLLRLGIRCLSVAPVFVPAVKQAIRETTAA